MKRITHQAAFSLNWTGYVLEEPTIAEMMAIMLSWSCQMAVAFSPRSSSSKCPDSDDEEEDEEEDQHWEANVESRR